MTIKYIVKHIVLHYHTNDDFGLGKGINNDLNWLVIYHFYEPVNNNKNQIIAHIF